MKVVLSNKYFCSKYFTLLTRVYSLLRAYYNLYMGKSCIFGQAKICTQHWTILDLFFVQCLVHVRFCPLMKLPPILAIALSFYSTENVFPTLDTVFPWRRRALSNVAYSKLSRVATCSNTNKITTILFLHKATRWFDVRHPNANSGPVMPSELNTKRVLGPTIF